MIDFIVSRPELFWFFLGLFLLLLELVIPGFVIFFFGAGAWMTSLLCLLFNPGFELQILIFLITSVISLIAFRRLIQKKILYGKSDNSDLVEDEFTGREARALTNIKPGKKGKVEFKGTVWSAESDSEIFEGDIVMIERKENFNLIVTPKSK